RVPAKLAGEGESPREGGKPIEQVGLQERREGTRAGTSARLPPCRGDVRSLPAAPALLEPDEILPSRQKPSRSRASHLQADRRARDRWLFRRLLGISLPLPHPAEKTSMSETLPIPMREIKLSDLKAKSAAELLTFAEEHEVENASLLRKQELLFA